MELSQDKSAQMISQVAQFVETALVLLLVIFADRPQAVRTYEDGHLKTKFGSPIRHDADEAQ